MNYQYGTVLRGIDRFGVRQPVYRIIKYIASKRDWEFAEFVSITQKQKQPNISPPVETTIAPVAGTGTPMNLINCIQSILDRNAKVSKVQTIELESLTTWHIFFWPPFS